MKGKWFVLFCTLLTCLAASSAFAAIDGGHHDVSAYTVNATRFTCYACHGFKETQATVANLGSVGSLCYNRCHRGAGGLTGAIPIATTFVNIGNENGSRVNNANNGPTVNGVTATTLDKYQTGGSHGRSWVAFPAADNLATKPALTANWPHLSTTATDIECTGCHDVHNNTYAPFLRAPQSQATGAASAAATFCVMCHTGSAATGDGRWTLISSAKANAGGHPIEVDSATSATAATRNATGRLGRRIVIKGALDNTTVFKNASPYTVANLNSPTSHYRPGGKLGAFTSTDNGVVGCYTCHAVHAPATHVNNNLVAPIVGSTGWTNNNFDTLCEGCHGTAGAPGMDNPGVTAYYHPVNGSAVSNGGTTPDFQYQVSTGAFNIFVRTGGALLGTGNRIVCTSCHGRAHAGNTAANQPAVIGTWMLNLNRPSCESCHDVTAFQAGTTANSHHVYGGGRNYLTGFGTYANPSYMNAATNKVDLANGLSCEDCHVFNGTAHNW